MRPLDAEQVQPQAANAAPQAQMRPQDAWQAPPAVMRPPDAGHPPPNQSSKIPWAVALVGIFVAFIFGAAFGTGGSPHLNTAVAYLRLNLFNRGAAHDLQLWANSVGLPLNIAQPGAFSNIIGTVVAFSFAWRRVRGGHAA